MQYLVENFPELVEIGIISRLYPRDINAFAYTCAHVRQFRTHPLAMHVRKFMSTVRALHAHYVIYRGDTYVARIQHDANRIIGYAIQHRSELSIRDHTIYSMRMNGFGCSIGSTSMILYASRAMSMYDAHRTEMYIRSGKIEIYLYENSLSTMERWQLHIITLECILGDFYMRIVNYIGDIANITCALEHSCEWRMYRWRRSYAT